MVTNDGIMPDFNIAWTETVNDCGASFSYQIESTCGGRCSINTGSTSGVCSDWSATGQCSVTVRAVSDLCGGQDGNNATMNVNLAGTVRSVIFVLLLY